MAEVNIEMTINGPQLVENLTQKKQIHQIASKLVQFSQFKVLQKTGNLLAIFRNRIDIITGGKHMTEGIIMSSDPNSTRLA